MDFVRRRNSIPIPQIVGTAVVEDGGSWILMMRLPGVELGSASAGMSKNARQETIQQLKAFVEQLQQLRPSEDSRAGQVASCSGGAVYDHRLDNRDGMRPLPRGSLTSTTTPSLPSRRARGPTGQPSIGVGCPTPTRSGLLMPTFRGRTYCWIPKPEM